MSVCRTTSGVKHPSPWSRSPENSIAATDELIAYTRDRLAHFKCPTRVEYVSELPRTATGKVLKTTLRKDYGGRESALGR